MTRLIRDPYTTLGVPRSATAREIKKAYRRLAREHHPDRNPGDTKAASERFKEIGSAYAVLGDAMKRAEFDIARVVGARPRAKRPGPVPRPAKRSPRAGAHRAPRARTPVAGFDEFFSHPPPVGVNVGVDLDEPAPSDLGDEDAGAGDFSAEPDAGADDDYADEGGAVDLDDKPGRDFVVGNHPTRRVPRRNR